jgi:hypothetical protein
VFSYTITGFVAYFPEPILSDSISVSAVIKKKGEIGTAFVKAVGQSLIAIRGRKVCDDC